MTASGLHGPSHDCPPHLPIMTNSSLLSRRVSPCWCFLSCRYFIVDLLPWKENEVGKTRNTPVCSIFGLGTGSWLPVCFFVVGGRWLKSFCLCLWWLISDLRGVTIAQDPRLDLWPVDHDVDRATSQYHLSVGQRGSLILVQVCALVTYQVILGVKMLHYFYISVVLTLLSETGMDEPSVLQLNVRPSYSMCCNWMTSAFASWQNKL